MNILTPIYLYKPCVRMTENTVIATWRPSNTNIAPSSSVTLTLRRDTRSRSRAGLRSRGSPALVPFTDKRKSLVISTTVEDFRSSIVTIPRHKRGRQVRRRDIGRRLQVRPHGTFLAEILKFCSITSCHRKLITMNELRISVRCGLPYDFNVTYILKSTKTPQSTLTRDTVKINNIHYFKY